MKISIRTTIDRPAAEVWDVVGRRFGDASLWASSIDLSRAVGAPTLSGAPSEARECQVAVPGAGRLVEQLVDFDEEAMILTYALAGGMERIARSARNTWQVVATGDGRCELRIDAEFELTGLGRGLAPLIRPYLTTVSRRNADDLRVYVETGRPSARKQRRQARSEDTAPRSSRDVSS